MRAAGSYVAAIDIGGTTIKSVLLTADSREVPGARRPTSRDLGPDAVVRAVLDFATATVEAGHCRFGRAPAAIGVACLGQVDEQSGRAVQAGAIGWTDVPLRDLIAERTGLPVAVGHDLRAGALAESRDGAGRGLPSFLFVAVGTGIGAAIVHNGQILTGARNLAGELGHVVVEPSGYDCVCGSRGCLEAEVSGAAITRRYADQTGASLPAAEVARRAAAGEVVAGQVWRTAVGRLARGLATAAALLDPALIVVGGGVSLAGEHLFAPLRSALGEQFRLGPTPPVVPSALGDRSACLGAGILAWRLTDAGDREAA